MAEVLARRAGYATFCVGKWHLCPMARRLGGRARSTSGRSAAASTASTASSRARPISSTPTSSTTTTTSSPRQTPEDGYHLTEDLVDQAIGFIHDSTSTPPRPALLLLPRPRRHPRARTRPRPSTWRSTRGRCDEGWDVVRDEWFARQQRAGAACPPDTELPPRNPGVEPWDELLRQRTHAWPPACRRRSPPSSSTPMTQLGRLFDYLARLGVLDDTLVVPDGRQRCQPGGRPLRRAPRDEVLQRHPRDARRGHRAPRRHRRTAQPLQLPVGWAQAGNTPFKLVQAEHPRGRRPRAAHRPLARRHRRRAARSATSSTTSSTSRPPIYEVVGIDAARHPTAAWPAAHRRARRCATRSPRPSSRAASRVQYFEMIGHRAI